MRRTILVLSAVVGVLWGTALPSTGAELPRAQLDESERHFTRAYAYFLERDYWNTLDYLYLRMLLGFLFAAAIVYGYRSFFP